MISREVMIMLRFSKLGFFSLFGSILTLLLQAIITLTSNDLAWKKLSVVDVVEPHYYGWTERITLFNFDSVSRYILEMPLYALFFCLTILFFTLSGLFERD